MSEAPDLICPWCQTEIKWDPELGPEEMCPNCYNDLGEYRSISLKVKQTGQPLRFDDAEEEEEPEDEETDGDFYDDELEAEAQDAYEEGVHRLLDAQEEPPECPTCRSFMLLVGSQPASADFVPHIHAGLRGPALGSGFTQDVFVCPSCFKVETLLSGKDRRSWIERLSRHGGAEG